MIWQLINFLFRFSGRIYFSNEQKSWATALQSSKSYNDKNIFDKIIKLYDLIKNKDKEFYERDSLIFHQKPDETELINFLNQTIKNTKKPLEILDYGGSLGSRYYSNYNFIVNKNINWNIIEQQDFVQYGKKKLQNKRLNFYYDLNDCFKDKKVNFTLFSNSLQYLENYTQILKEIKDQNVKYFFFDYLPLSFYKNHKIFIQNISKRVYESSYPIHIFSKNSFIKDIKNLNFKVCKLKKKSTVFYGFNYYSLALENLDFK
ncbi:methyltransferase, TIGR04325 family [Candidatus Pelagibacter sp.]|jgi:putative methyltransferase (TIGR04325 family)|nr:methyltransferase, TIGR04325 family [Candidatus Pelagibacter sp.]